MKIFSLGCIKWPFWPLKFFLWLRKKVFVSKDMQLNKVQYLYLFQYLGVLTQTHLKFWSIGFFFSWMKKWVSGVGLSTPRHVTAMGNTTCTTWALLELLLEPLFSECWSKNSYHQATPPCGKSRVHLNLIKKKITNNELLCVLAFSNNYIPLHVKIIKLHASQQNELEKWMSEWVSFLLIF